jgi:hypothetical protein
VTPAELVHVAALDVEARYEDAFDAWFAGVHLPELFARPGWNAARRYECTAGEPRRLVVYDLDERALEGPLKATPFADPEIGRRVRNYSARTFRRVLTAGEDPAQAELVNVITVDVDAEHAEAFDRWYSEVHVPEILACPGWRGACRYESIDGDPRFLAIYALDDPVTPFATEEYEAAVGWDEHTDQIRGYHGFRIYRLLR